MDKNDEEHYPTRILKRETSFTALTAALLLLALTSCSTGDAARAAGSEGPDPQELPVPLAAIVGSLEPREELHVDLADRFWTWQDDTRQLTRWDSEGRRESTVRLPAGVAVDAHSTWGILRLASGGHELQHFDWQGALQATQPLTSPAGSVKWIDPHQAAIAPKQSENWVEIWDLKIGARVRAMGEAEPVATTPGGRFSRGVRLQPVPSRRRLYTLESRTGEGVLL